MIREILPRILSRRLILPVVAMCLLMAGCGGAAKQPADTPDVMVSILPQAWFVEQIAGPEWTVEVLVGPGQSPATFDPTSRQIARLLGAKLFVRAGVPFERSLMPKIERLPGRPRILLPPAMADELNQEPAHGKHQPHNGHHHGGIDPHTWLDPNQARAQASALAAALIELRPTSADSIRVRAAALDSRLTRLDTEIKALLAPYRGESFFVFHPAFGHFARAYGLKQVAIEIDGHEPGPRHLAQVIAQARAAGARTIIVQPQFSREVAGRIAAEIDAGVIALDPLARPYEENLKYLADRLAEEFAARESRKEDS